MSRHAIVMTLFAAFAIGLPLWGMQANERGGGNTHLCVGECYETWRDTTGGIVQIAKAAAAEAAAASPEELGQKAYMGCVACHGAGGEGGIGPQLAGTPADDTRNALLQYRAGETRGAQSSLMWSQAQALSDQDIENLTAFINTL